MTSTMLTSVSVANASLFVFDRYDATWHALPNTKVVPLPICGWEWVSTSSIEPVPSLTINLDFLLHTNTAKFFPFFLENLSKCNVHEMGCVNAHSQTGSVSEAEIFTLQSFAFKKKYTRFGNISIVNVITFNYCISYSMKPSPT